MQSLPMTLKRGTCSLSAVEVKKILLCMIEKIRYIHLESMVALNEWSVVVSMVEPNWNESVLSMLGSLSLSSISFSPSCTVAQSVYRPKRQVGNAIGWAEGRFFVQFLLGGFGHWFAQVPCLLLVLPTYCFCCSGISLVQSNYNQSNKQNWEELRRTLSNGLNVNIQKCINTNQTLPLANFSCRICSACHSGHPLGSTGTFRLLLLCGLSLSRPLRWWNL